MKWHLASGLTMGSIKLGIMNDTVHGGKVVTLILLYPGESAVFLYAGLRIASKMMASVLTSRTEQ